MKPTLRPRGSAVTRLALVLSCVLSSACGGGGGGGGGDGGPRTDQQPAPSAPASTPDPAPTTNRAFPQFAVTFDTGEYWEYAWDYASTTGSPGSVSTREEAGRVRIELDAPTTLAGRQGWPLTVSGTSPVDLPWQALAYDDDGLYGLADGAWIVLFDAVRGAWPGGGFFAAFDPDTLTEATDAQIDNAYLSRPAILAGGSRVQDRCETIAGVLVCGDSSSSAREFEYYDAVVGVLGYEFANNAADSGGGFDTIFNEALELGLVAASLRGDAVDHVLEVEPNNTPASAFALPAGVTLRGSLAREDDFGGGVSVSLAIPEGEPNDSLAQAGIASLDAVPAVIAGRIASSDAGLSLVTQEPDDNRSFSRTLEDLFAIELATRCARFGASHSPEAEGRIDLLLLRENPGGDPIVLANDLVLTPVGLQARNTLDRTPALEAGTSYYLAVDAVDVPEALAYEVNLTCDGLAAPRQVEVFDWYSVSLVGDGPLTVTASDAVGLVVTGPSGIDLLGQGEIDPSTSRERVQLELPSGEYRIGVTRGGPYTLEAAY